MGFICTNCGVTYAKWQGKCDSCKMWNMMESYRLPVKSIPLHNHPIKQNSTQKNQPKKLEDILVSNQKCLLSPDGEFNRVLGEGIVPGSLVLLGGEPGIGKSTLLLQIALQLKQVKVLYVSGEETESQIKIRASRIGLDADHCFFLQENTLESIINHTNDLRPALLIIDSIQTLYCQEEEGSIGSINQIKSCATQLFHYAKMSGVAIFVIGHVNKEGTLAGPKLLEHMVDTVLQFEGDKQFLYRMIRTIKNRFGATSELGIYEMKANGLHPITNPSKILLSGHTPPLNGIAIGSCLEGTRPLMIEIQALITETKYGYPQRNATGYDLKRLTMLLAVLEKRAGVRLNDRDVFLNITGGLKIEDSALDLAICMAIVSSLKERTIPHDHCFIAEIGLGGELRTVPKLDKRILEAKKLGFKEVFIAKQRDPFIKNFAIKINQIESLTKLT